MKKLRLWAVSALAVSLLLMMSACSATSGTSAAATQTAEIALSDGGITITGAGADTDGNIVTISSPGTYTVTGSLQDGQIYVNAGTEGEVNIILAGAVISNATDPAIYIEQADKAVITLMDGKENAVTSGEALPDAAETADSGDDTADETGAAILSKDDLTITGGGSLTVNGYINNGIQSKDDLTIESGVITVTAANNAIKGKDSVTISDGTFNITALGDGIKSDNTEDEAKGTVSISGGTFTIDAQGDAVQAETTLNISGGAFDVVTGGGSANAETVAGEAGNMGGGRFNGGAMPSSGTQTSDTTRPDGSAGMQGPGGGGMQGGPGGTDGETATATGTSAEQTAFVSGTAAADTTNTTAVTDTVSCKAFKGGTSVTISGGSFTIDACDDAIHSNGDIAITGGTIDIKSGDDGVHADGALTVDSGTIGVTESYEGLEGQSVTITGGDISIVSSDDGINAAGGSDSSGMMGAWAQDSFSDSGDIFIRITGGTVTINADGDGIDSNGDLFMEGGGVYVDGPENSANGALDSGSESGGEITVTGGTIVAAGASGMAEGFGTNSTQYSFLYNFSSAISAGSEITVKDSDGNTILTYTAKKSFSSVEVSSPELKEGETYTVTAGDQSAEITMSAIAVNSSGGMGMGSGGTGGRPGGGGQQMPGRAS